MSITAAAVAAGIIGAASSLAGEAVNMHNVAVTNKANAEIQAGVNATNLQIANNANAFSAEQAQIQREWDAHKIERTMADMKAAGINPILAAQSGNSGSSVSSPYVATGYAQANKLQAPHISLAGITNAISAAAEISRFSALIGDKKAYQAANDTQINLLDNQATSALKTSKVLKQDSDRIYQAVQTAKRYVPTGKDQWSNMPTGWTPSY